MSIWSEKSN
uniref:Uncharacterized protein n=1 Tax=Anguilla anguilla TaxID=7936 RepID=A0A0E9SGR9_ANGAN